MKTNDRLISSRRSPFSSFLSKNQRQIIGGIIFIIGSLFGFGFNGLAVIADLNGASFWGDSRDGVNFDRQQPTQVDLVRMHCPILLAPGEEATITATFRNPNPEKADILVKAVVSERDFRNYRVLTGSLPIESRNEQDFRWQITQQDIVERNFILTRVFLFYEDTPARTESCGIFVLGLFGLKGASIVVLTFVTSLVFLFVGSVLLYRANPGPSYQKSSPPIEVGLYGLAGHLTDRYDC